MMAIFFRCRLLAACRARPAPSALSLARMRNAVLKPCCEYFGFVAEGVPFDLTVRR